MPELRDFIPIDIHTLRNATRGIPFDLYLKLSENNIAHVFSKTTGLDYKRLAQYIFKGVKELYIRREEEQAYRQFIARPAEVILADPTTSHEKKIATLLNMTEQNIAELFVQLNIPEETAATSQKIVKNYVHLMAENPNTLAVILKLVAHGDYLYYHSVAVAIFSIFIAKATGQMNQSMLETVGLGGFLHDIGCIQISKEVNCSSSELSAEQWKEMRTHPQLGLQMIEKTPNISDEVRYIVYQHHERPDGQGYPNGIVDSVIYYPAKIVGLADAFSALISKRPFRSAYSVEQAIHILQTEKGKFDPALVQLIAGIFLKFQRAKAA